MKRVYVKYGKADKIILVSKEYDEFRPKKNPGAGTLTREIEMTTKKAREIAYELISHALQVDLRERKGL
jgi:hypothetical protein